MAKGKGRQSLGFQNKAHKAQFFMECKSLLIEERLSQKSRRAQIPKVSKERPTVHLSLLYNLLQERQHADRIEHVSARQGENHLISGDIRSRPGSLLYFQDENYDIDEQVGCKSLQSLCLRALVPILPQYLELMGETLLHQYISTFPPRTIAALSIFISSSIGMSNALLRLFNHSHVTRISVYAPNMDDETDCSWRALTKEGLNFLIPSWGNYSDSVPCDSWEDYNWDNEELLQMQGCQHLERLELGNLTSLSAECVEKLLSSCTSLTHLGISGTFSYESGPEVLQYLPDWLPNLLFLDLTGNHWVNEALVRRLLKEYKIRHHRLLHISCSGCMPPTIQHSLELEFHDQGNNILRKSYLKNRHCIVEFFNSIYMMTKSNTRKITDDSETKRTVVIGSAPNDQMRNKRQKATPYQGNKRTKSSTNDRLDRSTGSNLEMSDKNTFPNEGSYASQTMQDLLQVTIPDISPQDTKKSKKKLAMLIAYIGSNFSGFQINKGQKTIQAEIELALYKSGLLLQSNFGFPQKYGWSVSGRTDKGVHACAQVCSCKLEVGEMTFDEIRESINANLHPDISILDVKRAIRSFCAKTDRSRVRYQYMIPSYLFYPNAKTLFDDMGINRRAPDAIPITPEEIENLRQTIKDYRISSEQLNTLRTALQKYVGTRAYHNFTKGMDLGNASAQRYILEFSVQDPIVREDGTEWIPTQVIGQAFLLNQIRKMIALVCDVVCERATMETMDRAFDKGTKMILPLAPAQGLFMDMSIYDDYNRRIGSLPNDASPLDWINQPHSPAMQRWKAFKDDVILRKIVEEEQQEGNFIMYLYMQTNRFEWQERYHGERTGDN